MVSNRGEAYKLIHTFSANALSKLVFFFWPLSSKFNRNRPPDMNRKNSTWVTANCFLQYYVLTKQFGTELIREICTPRTAQITNHKALFYREPVCHIIKHDLVVISSVFLNILQIDTYGLLGTIHCLLFLDYMKVYKDERGRWKITKSFRRYVRSNLFLRLLSLVASDLFK